MLPCPYTVVSEELFDWMKAGGNVTVGGGGPDRFSSIKWGSYGACPMWQLVSNALRPVSNLYLSVSSPSDPGFGHVTDQLWSMGEKHS